jgi:hypothetical protein
MPIWPWVLPPPPPPCSCQGNHLVFNYAEVADADVGVDDVDADAFPETFKVVAFKSLDIESVCVHGKVGVGLLEFGFGTPRMGDPL